MVVLPAVMMMSACIQILVLKLSTHGYTSRRRVLKGTNSDKTATATEEIKVWGNTDY
jgi:hypothetical protein